MYFIVLNQVHPTEVQAGTRRVRCTYAAVRRLAYVAGRLLVVCWSCVCVNSGAQSGAQLPTLVPSWLVPQVWCTGGAEVLGWSTVNLSIKKLYSEQVAQSAPQSASVCRPQYSLGLWALAPPRPPLAKTANNKVDCTTLTP
jgi:hypothetical protein